NIEVVCPTADSDLDIVTASVAPQYIEPLQANLLLKSTVKNIGNSSSATCTMEYWLSDDIVFDEDTDIYVGSGAIPALTMGESTMVSSLVTAPAELVPGNYYMIFVADRENSVPETDDENRFSVYVTVPEAGIMDCATAISLISGDWHRGNTLTDGTNLIEEYSAGRDMTGPEVIHSFIPSYTGMAEITFVEKSTGSLSAIVLPVCNENTIENILKLYNPVDTLISGSVYVVAGNQYFIVVDGEKGASGEYALKVDLPGECPDVTVQHWGSLDLCEGDPWPGFWTGWGYSSYQWYRDGVAIQGAVNSSLSATGTGNYHVDVTENGCTASSVTFTVRMDMPPDTALIATDDPAEFCDGAFALLRLDNTVLFPVNWALNDTLLAGETATTLSANRPGKYSLYTINGACRVKSDNTISVNVISMPADIGGLLPVPSDSIEFFYPFALDNKDVSGNNYLLAGWDYEPADDRFGNFWQARHLQGESQILYSSNNRSIPEDFTLSLWFRTTTTSGGMIAGFVDNPWGPAKIDAVLYMSDDGKLRFWISNSATPVELASSSSYNDGNWHQVVLQHDGLMTLDINSGTEMLISAVTAVKEVFKGYWTFGGPDIPATVAAMPSSKHFNGTIDDLMCFNEVNTVAMPWLGNEQRLVVQGPDHSAVCYPGTLEFELPLSQRGVEYRVWNKTLSTWAPLSAVGTGGSLTIGGSDVVIGINEFQIAAKDLLTGCELILDTLISYIVSVCTAVPELPGGNLLKVYPVPASEVLHFESVQIIEELKILDSRGRVVHNTKPAGSNAGINVSSLPDGIYFYRLTTAEKLVITGKVVIIGGRQ
ncbi:MAG: T9SS type A sorting domain-containing protein, partial [Bacteroidales bacterium]